jgi:hypothetical protein
MLKAEVAILSNDCHCRKTERAGCSDYKTLTSDQEEADTKVVLHIVEALS